MKDKERKTGLPANTPMYVGKATLDLWNLWKEPVKPAVGSSTEESAEDLATPEPSSSSDPL